MAPAASELSPQRIRRIALGDVIHRSARRFGERAALIDGDQRVSYRELNETSNRFAHHLLDLGLSAVDQLEVDQPLERAAQQTRVVDAQRARPIGGHP